MKQIVYYSMLLFTVFFYLTADFSKSITQFYAIVLIIIALMLVIPERVGSIKFKTVGIILCPYLAFPLIFWLKYSGNTFSWFGVALPIEFFGCLWHLIMAVYPFLDDLAKASEKKE